MQRPGAALRACAWPPWTSTARRAMDRPSPTPPSARLRSSPTRKNGSKSDPNAPSGTPGPRSRTAMLASPRSSRRSTAIGVPSGACRIALRTTFSTPRRSSSRSPRIAATPLDAQGQAAALRPGLRPRSPRPARPAAHPGGPVLAGREAGVALGAGQLEQLGDKPREPVEVRPDPVEGDLAGPRPIRASSRLKPSRARGDRSSCETSCNSLSSADLRVSIWPAIASNARDSSPISSFRVEFARADSSPRAEPIDDPTEMPQRPGQVDGQGIAQQGDGQHDRDEIGE